MLRGNAARTGEHPGPGPASSPDLVNDAGLGDLIVSSPVVADGVIYVGSVSPSLAAGGALHALDLKSGDEIWRTALDRGDGILATPAVADGVVYVATYDGVVLAVEAATGHETWRALLDAPVYYAAPAVEGGLLYLVDIEGRLYALDTDDGRRAWRSAADPGALRGLGTPAVAADLVFVVSTPVHSDAPSALLALDAATGEERWRFVSKDSGDVRGGPAVADDRVFVSTTLGAVYGLSAHRGSVDWRFDSDREISASSPAVADGEVIVGTDDGGVHVVDAVTGEPTRALPDQDGDGFLTSPTVADGVLYTVGTAGALHAVDLDTAQELWSVSTGSIGSSPAIIGGFVVIGDEFGFLNTFG